jgi:hypothetical protein
MHNAITCESVHNLQRYCADGTTKSRTNFALFALDTQIMFTVYLLSIYEWIERIKTVLGLPAHNRYKDKVVNKPLQTAEIARHVNKCLVY